MTFRGPGWRLRRRACGKDPQSIEIRSFDPGGLDPKARKAFPLRMAHFLVDIHRARRELAWEPDFDLESGLDPDSYMHINDYKAGRESSAPDFSRDQELLQR